MLREAQAGIDLNDLGETPRLGLAVVGRLAQANGFQVSLRPSAYGGVRAVLVVPQEQITSAPGTGMAHGIGAASGSRPGSGPSLSERVRHVAPSPRSAEAPAAKPVALDSVFADSVPAQARTVDPEAFGLGTPLAGSSSAEALSAEEPPRVAATGLPQRRRRALRADLAGRRAPAAGAGAADSVLPAAGAAQSESVQPGLWLAAFQGGVSDPSAHEAGAGAGAEPRPGGGGGHGDGNTSADERGDL
jgi:hypothetical protein